MSKPVLFIDIDGTLVDSIPWWLALYNYDHQTTFTKHDITQYDIEKAIGINLEPYYLDYRGARFVEGAYDAVVRLQTKYRIVYVTVGFGIEWVRQHGYIHKMDFAQIADRSLLRGYALIDDCPANLDVFQGERFLVRQPWNEGRGLNDTTWKDIARHLMEVEHE